MYNYVCVGGGRGARLVRVCGRMSACVCLYMYVCVIVILSLFRLGSPHCCQEVSVVHPLLYRASTMSLQVGSR